MTWENPAQPKTNLHRSCGVLACIACQLRCLHFSPGTSYTLRCLDKEDEEWICPSLPFPYCIWEIPEKSLSKVLLGMFAALSQQPLPLLGPYPATHWAILESTPCSLARRGHGEWALTKEEKFLLPDRSFTGAQMQPPGWNNITIQKGATEKDPVPIGNCPASSSLAKGGKKVASGWFYPVWITKSEPNSNNLPRPT